MSTLVCDRSIDKFAYESPEQQKEIDKMAKRLQDEGQREPIRLREDLTIIDGHLRYFAARRLGFKLIKAVIISTKEW